MGNGPVDNYAFTRFYRVPGGWYAVRYYWHDNGFYEGTAEHQ